MTHQNSNDRELLELAAKAAGLRVRTWEGHSGIRCAIDDGRHGHMWMPLTDDGDALRLAVKLNIAVWFVSYPHGLTGFPGGDFVKAVGISVVHIPLDVGDNTAATRRAIVQAAADTGRAMP